MLAPYRDRVVSSARGRVLEVGIGSGLNLPFYASAATEIIGLDPSPKLLEMANKAARKTPIPLRLIEGTAEAIPIQDHDVAPKIGHPTSAPATSITTRNNFRTNFRGWRRDEFSIFVRPPQGGLPPHAALTRGPTICLGRGDDACVLDAVERAG